MNSILSQKKGHLKRDRESNTNSVTDSVTFSVMVFSPFSSFLPHSTMVEI
jgi:hypothetical protein